MIIVNGTIEAKHKTGGGGLDPVTGYPKKAEASWGEPIPCQYIPNQHNKLGVVNGEHFTIASYTVLIEEQEFNAEQIRLKDRTGTLLGEFSIMQVEPLEAVCEIRLTI